MTRELNTVDLFVPKKGLHDPAGKKAARQWLALTLFGGACFASAAADHWKTAMSETPEEREKRMERIRKEAAERAAREEAFRARYRVRSAERTCGNCKHCEEEDDGCCVCKHPDLCGNPIFTPANTVCDAWEGRGRT